MNQQFTADYDDGKDLFNKGQITESIRKFRESLEAAIKYYHSEQVYELARIYFGYGTALLAQLEDQSDQFGKELMEQQLQSTNSKDKDKDIDVLQLAWENLEVARVISEKRNQEVQNTRTFSDRDKQEVLMRIAKVKLRLGDFQAYQGKYNEALHEYQDSLKYRIESEHDEKEKQMSRDIAESRFMIGVALLRLGHDEQAINSFNESRVLLENKLKHLLGLSQGYIFGSRNIFNVDQKMSHEVVKQMKTDTPQVIEIRKVLADIYQRIESIMGSKQQIQKHELGKKQNLKNEHQPKESMSQERIIDMDWLLHLKKMRDEGNSFDLNEENAEASLQNKKIKIK